MTTVIQFLGTGRRKCAIARVRLIPGTGQITINDRDQADYLGKRYGLPEEISGPIKACNAMGRYDVIATVNGGGVAGQAGAIKHGIARALAQAAPQDHPILRGEGFLTRDSRIKERKKYGRKRARKRFQFSKR